VQSALANRVRQVDVVCQGSQQLIIVVNDRGPYGALNGFVAAPPATSQGKLGEEIEPLLLFFFIASFQLHRPSTDLVGFVYIREPALLYLRKVK